MPTRIWPSPSNARPTKPRRSKGRLEPENTSVEFDLELVELEDERFGELQLLGPAILEQPLVCGIGCALLAHGCQPRWRCHDQGRKREQRAGPRAPALTRDAETRPSGLGAWLCVEVACGTIRASCDPRPERGLSLRGEPVPSYLSRPNSGSGDAPVPRPAPTSPPGPLRRVSLAQTAPAPGPRTKEMLRARKRDCSSLRGPAYLRSRL